MNGPLAPPGDLSDWLWSPLLWGMVVAALGLWGILANNGARARSLGKFVAAVGLAGIALAMPKLSALANAAQWGEQIVFWLLAAVALGCSAAAISARNPVYTAIWFAGSLLGVAGLFLFQHAQFLGVATVVVYAGAIVVTFLFVLMLANPEGQAHYDRVSWSKLVVPLVLGVGIVLVLVVAREFSVRPPAPSGQANVLAPDHMAQLGTELFARHLVAVEVAGTLLLVALVGAVSIVMHGQQRRRPAVRPAGAAQEGGTQA